MPIGVPKVPYRIPGDEEATWVDLYNVMYRERTLFFLVHCPIHRKKCFSTGINILSGISSDNCCIVSQPHPRVKLYSSLSRWKPLCLRKRRVGCRGGKAPVSTLLLVSFGINSSLAGSNLILWEQLSFLSFGLKWWTNPFSSLFVLRMAPVKMWLILYIHN